MELQRTTSAGYRLPISSSKPQFNGGVAEATARNARLEDVLTHKIGGKLCDAVCFDKILTSRIENEWKAVEKWRTNWSFLAAEYNSEGARKIKKNLTEEKSTFFNSSASVPVTQAGNYGNRQQSECAKAIIKFQLDMGKPLRRRQMGSEFQCC